jgi:hypothetical protein
MDCPSKAHSSSPSSMPPQSAAGEHSTTSITRKSSPKATPSTPSDAADSDSVMAAEADESPPSASNTGDLWELDTLNLMWTPLNYSGTPSARHSPGFISLSAGRILLYGGQDAQGIASSELLILDLAARAWTPLAASGVCPIDTLSARVR